MPALYPLQAETVQLQGEHQILSDRVGPVVMLTGMLQESQRMLWNYRNLLNAALAENHQLREYIAQKETAPIKPENPDPLRPQAGV